jgi:hypothetical protein
VNEASARHLTVIIIRRRLDPSPQINEPGLFTLVFLFSTSDLSEFHLEWPFIGKYFQAVTAIHNQESSYQSRHGEVRGSVEDGGEDQGA